MIVDLRARTARLERDLSKANRRMAYQGKKMGRSLGSGFSSAFLRFAGPAVIAGTITSLSKRVVSLGSTISDMATGARIGVEEFQVLDYAMRVAGGQSQNLANSLVKMQKSIYDAGRGLSTAIDGFGGLGIKFEDLRDLAPERQLEALAKGLANAGNKTLEAGAAFDLLGGRNAPKLREVLGRLGTEGFDVLAEKARKAGQVMSADLIQDLDILSDRWDTFKRKLDVGFGGMIGWVNDQFDERKSHEIVERIKELDELIQASERGAHATGGRLGINRFGPAMVEGYKGEREELLKEINKMEETRRQVADLGKTIAKGPDEELMAFAAQVTESLKSDAELALEHIIQLEESHEKGLLNLEQRNLAASRKVQAIWESMDALAEGGKLSADVQMLWQKMVNLGVYAFESTGEEVEEFGEKLENEMGKLGGIWQNLTEDMSRELAEALVRGRRSFDDFLRHIVERIQAAAVEEMLVKPLLKVLGLGGNGEGGGSNGGLFGKLFKSLGFAGGGRPPVGQASVVGERGPELFVPNTAGVILPNRALAGMGGGSQIIRIEQTLNFNTSLQEVRAQIAEAAPIIAQATEAQIIDHRRRGRRI